MIRFGSLDWGTEEKKAIEDIISQKEPQLTLGKKVYEFEREFASWLGSKYAVMVNSGTSALIAAISGLKQLGIIEKNQIIFTSALTYCANWNALNACGVFWSPVDVEDDFVIHNDKFGCKNKFFLGIDLLGKPCQVGNLIDDASEALGSKVKNKKLGTQGYCGTFSFYVAHQINTIEGGMVVTDLKELYEALLSIRDNGRICTCPVCSLKTKGKCAKRLENSSSVERRWSMCLSGYNFKPTEIQGALGLCKMKKIDEICKRRHAYFQMYADEFNTMVEEDDEYIVPLAYPVKVKNPSKALSYMQKKGIECRGMFPAYSSTYKNAYRISKEYILVPAHQELNFEDVEYIIGCVKECQSLV